MTGRPTKLTDELRADLCEHIASPMAVRHACAMVGLGESTFFDWMKRGADGEPGFAEFSEAVARARAEAASKLVAGIATAAAPMTWTNPDTGKKESISAGDWRAGAWLAERMFPDEYGNRVQVDQHTTGVLDINLPDGAGDAAAEFVRKLGEQADGAAS